MKYFYKEILRFLYLIISLPVFCIIYILYFIWNFSFEEEPVFYFVDGEYTEHGSRYVFSVFNCYNYVLGRMNKANYIKQHYYNHDY